MKVQCNREKMLTAFQIVAPVAPLRSPKPILKNVKFEATGAWSRLMATDLEQGISVDVTGVNVEVPGAAILPIGRFGSILRESTGEILQIAVDAQGTIVEGERSEFRLPAEDPDEFPAVSEFEQPNYYEMSARLFREIIRRTIFAIDSESSRYALAGVLLEVSGERITAVSTDGRRLAKMEGGVTAVGDVAACEEAIIVPGRAMQLMERALSDADTEIQIATRANEILVKSRRSTIYSRLLEGRFPRWREVFPRRDNARKVDVPVGPLHAAVRQAAIVTSDESRGIDFTFRSGNLVLFGQTADVGQVRVDLPIGYEGSDLTVMLDPRFLIEFLRVLDPEKTVCLELLDAESAVVATTDDGYGYVIMPLSRETGRKQASGRALG